MNNITKEQLEELALRISLRFHLSDFDQSKPASETFDEFGENDNDKIVVWQPFEEWGVDDVAESIGNLSYDIEQIIGNALGIGQWPPHLLQLLMH